MTDDNASILSHVSIGTNDFDRSVMFYDAVLNTLNIKRVLQHPGAVAYGKQFPEFWVQIPHDGGRASTGNGTHFSFLADTKNQVQSFFVAAMANGAVSEGEPGPRSDYGPSYYGCFVKDPDGHKIEAMFWDTTQESHPEV